MLLAENGGDNITESVKRNMKYLFSCQLARQFNLCGQRDKYAFKPLQLFNVMFGRYIYAALFLLWVSEWVSSFCGYSETNKYVSELVYYGCLL